MDTEEFKPINPKPFLHQLIDKNVIVTLKFNRMQYKGTLVSVDTYFNIQLTDAEEIVNDVSGGKVGDIFIRCNNVLYIGECVSTSSAGKQPSVLSEQAADHVVESAASQTESS